MSPLAPSQKKALIFLAFFVSALFCVVAPRIGPLVVVSITAALCILLLLRDGRRERLDALGQILYRPEIPFILWTLIACLWSLDPGRAVLKVLFLAALILHAIILVNRFHVVEGRDIESAARGILFGFILGGVYLCIEIFDRDVITRYVLTHFPELDRAVPKHARVRDGVIVRMSAAHITRANATFCLLVCPALLAATLYTKGIVRGICYAAAGAFLLFIFVHPQTQSQTSQLVVAVLVAVIALGLLSPVLARWVVAAGFACWLFLIVPASIAMHSHGLHEKESLFGSARARVILWKGTAEEILKRPIFGIGTYSAHVYKNPQAAQRDELEVDKRRHLRNLYVGEGGRPHPHSTYLQVWFELGIVGVLTFALLGYSLLSRIRRLPRRMAVLATAHFAVCATVVGPSYGMWQNWLQSAIVASILALTLIMAAGIRSEPSQGASEQRASS